MTEVRLGEEELKVAAEVLQSGQLREGKYAREFEKRMSEWTGVKHAIAASSGTAALHLAYASVLKPGDEVLVPAFTFVATASMVAACGARPVFCDIDPETWLMDPKEIEAKITPKTRAIVPVHLFGNVCDMDAIRKIAAKHKLAIIGDAAQSLGSRYQNQDPAQFADLTCFSFYPTKNITTGEGGLVVTSDDRLAEKIRLLKSHGEGEKYTHVLVGFNYRMTELEAAIGVEQLKKLGRFLSRRRAIVAQYTEFFAKQACFEIQKTTQGCEHAHNYFSVRIRPRQISVSRDEFIRLLQEAGIPCAVHYPKPLNLQPCFEAYAKGPLKHSEALAKQIFALPLHPYLTDEAVKFITQKIEAVSSQTASAG